MIRSLSLLLALLSLLTACGGCTSLQEPPPPGDPPPFEVRLGPGDRIRMSVWGEERLQQDGEVGPSGSISFPLIGDVQVVGLTLDELRVELAQRIKALVLDPSVSITLVETRSSLVHVVGEVARPGPVTYVRGATTLGAVQAAGGYLAATADLEAVRVIRDRMGERAAFEVDVAGILAGEAPDLWLLPGDVVYVPPRLLTRWDRWWRQAFPWAEPIDLLPRQQR